MTTRTARRERSFGVVGGLAPAADADLMTRLAAEAASNPDGPALEFVYDGRLADQAGEPHATTAELLMRVYDAIDAFDAQGVGTVVLPLFLDLAFAGELASNSPLPIIEPLAALREHVRADHPGVRRLGILDLAPCPGPSPFEAHFPPGEFQLLSATSVDDVELASEARHRDDGPANGADPEARERLRAACEDLVRRGAQLILPGAPALAPVAAGLAADGFPVVDLHRMLAHHVVSGRYAPVRRPFKLGVVGGVGPAATLDFLQKVMRNTPARRDQDHLRLVVEQNPQIPDRTEHLVGDGVDPTLALYATCKKLQAGQADLIAIPCNTAHAFVEEIQAHLRIPIVNMLTVTVAHVRETFPALRRIGLLATTGTVASGVYRRALESQGLEQVVPRPALQARVMNAIYGPRGVKAGHVAGECVADVTAAIDDLVEQDVEVIVLGCTELPLLFPELAVTSPSGRRVTLVDPTEILAVRCVSQAMTWAGA